MVGTELVDSVDRERLEQVLKYLTVKVQVYYNKYTNNFKCLQPYLTKFSEYKTMLNKYS